MTNADILDQMVDTVMAIKSDPVLVQTFIQILEMGSSTQQVRVSNLHQALTEKKAPSQVLDFVQMLRDEKLAHAVLHELRS